MSQRIGPEEEPGEIRQGKGGQHARRTAKRRFSPGSRIPSSRLSAGDVAQNLIGSVERSPLGILGVFLVDFLHERKLSLAEFSARRVNVVVRWGAYIALTLLILLTVVQNYGQAASTFLYERF